MATTLPKQVSHKRTAITLDELIETLMTNYYQKRLAETAQ